MTSGNAGSTDGRIERLKKRGLAVGFLVLVAGCQGAAEGDDVATLVRKGKPASCSHRDTMAALTPLLGVAAAPVSAVTFGGADTNLGKVSCEAVVGGQRVTYDVTENLVRPGTVAIKMTSLPIAPPSAPVVVPVAVPAEASPPTPPARARGHTFDIPKYYPSAFAIWRRATARIPLDGREWVKTLGGTATEVRAVQIGGNGYLYGWVCEPHNCGGNETAVLISEDQKRVVGLVRLTGENRVVTEQFVGSPTTIEMRCASFLLDDRSDAVACR